MTAKKTTTVVQVEKESGPSFSTVWKWITGVSSAVAASSLIAIAAWVWNINGTIILMQSATDANTKSIETHENRLTHLSEEDSRTGALLAVTSQVNVALSERIRSLEQQNIWRDRARSNRP